MGGGGRQVARGRGKEQELGTHQRKFVSSRLLPECLELSLKGKRDIHSFNKHPLHYAKVICRPRGDRKSGFLGLMPVSLTSLPMECRSTPSSLAEAVKLAWLWTAPQTCGSQRDCDKVASGPAGRRPGEFTGPSLSQESPPVTLPRQNTQDTILRARQRAPISEHAL